MAPHYKVEKQYDMRNIGRPDPSGDPNCNICAGRGWAVFRVSNYGREEWLDCNGKLAVKSCDVCNTISSDMSAARMALFCGVECRTSYPCLLSSQSTESPNHVNEETPDSSPKTQNRKYKIRYKARAELQGLYLDT
jgi:hypothetical protein